MPPARATSTLTERPAADSYVGAGDGIVDGVMKPLVALLALAIVWAPLVSLAAPCHPGGTHEADCCLRHGGHPADGPHADGALTLSELTPASAAIASGAVAVTGAAAVTAAAAATRAGSVAGAAVTEAPVEVAHRGPDHRSHSQDGESCSRDCQLLTPAVAEATSQRPAPLSLDAIAASEGQPLARTSCIEHVPLTP